MSAPASAPSADRNLLFGILALQMDFIDREALIHAMHAWVLQKSTPLGQILLDQGALRVDTHALLEALVQKHLEMHGGDAQKSLASVSSLGSARGQLEQIADAQLHQSLAHVAANHAGEEDPFRTRPPSAGDPTSAGQRFHILRPHARGGLGEVFVAHDTELQREVALKEIQDRHADDPGSRSRFLLEAEITGGLEHPGIVPIYGLGRYADGRPFYAMRFIRGDSLQDAIRAFHEADVPGRDVGERTLALRKLLGRFLDVCNAVAYAHSRGVLHRDLKPANVMLGKYGETLVVDWGLAKPLGRAEAATESIEGLLQPSSAHEAAPTRMGSVIGTPAYMPPEQAAGQLDQLGPASDVYSLGATLYCLLTGLAPFPGKGDVGELLRRVQQGEFSRPRQVKTAVPAALEAVCLKAMALRPEDRYASPRALAEDLEHWLADEPVGAWREPWQMRVRRWARRHKVGLQTTAALVLALLLAGGGVGWALWDRAAQETARRQQLAGRRAETEKAVTVALTKAQQSEERAKRLPCGTSVEAKATLAEWREAEASLAEAEAALRTGAASDELRQRVAERLQRITSGRNQTQRKEKLFRDLDDARMAMVVWRGSYLDHAGVAAKFAAAFAAFGLDVQPGQTETLAQRIRGEEPVVRDALIVALDHWGFCVKNPMRARLSAIARAADDDTWRRAYRQAEEHEADKALVRLSQEARRLTLPSTSVLLLAAALANNDERTEARELLRWARRLHPADFWIAFELGAALGKPYGGMWVRKAANPLDLEEQIGCYRVAVALRPDACIPHANLGIALAAKKQLDEAEAECKKAIEVDPEYPMAHNNLGFILYSKKQLDRAIAAYKKASALDPNSALVHSNLGLALHDNNQLEEAIAECKKAIALDPKLAEAHTNLGVALQEKKQVDEAIAEYRKALDLDPELAVAHSNLGIALAGRNQLDEAEAECKKATELDPQLAQAHNNLGLVLLSKKQLDLAIDEFKKAIVLDADLARAHSNLGMALSTRGRPGEAIVELKKAIALEPRLAEAHNNLGSAFLANRQPDAALAAYKKAIALDPRFAPAHFNLGLVLYGKRQRDAAIVELRMAIALDPKIAEAHAFLGAALHDKKQLDAAIVEYKQAIELNPKLAYAHYRLGQALGDKEQLDEAIAEFKKAIALDPKDPLSHFNLGLVLRDKKQLDEAIVEFKKSIAVDPTIAIVHFILGQVLQSKEQLDEAIAEYKKAVALEPKDASAHDGLGAALLRQGRFAEAEASFQRCLSLRAAGDPERAATEEQIKRVRRYLELEKKLPSILSGETKPTDNAMYIDVVNLCMFKQLSLAAARFVKRALADKPELGDDPGKAFRYNAACFSALAAAGKGKDADKLTDPQRAELRKQALQWLRADLVAWAKRLDKDGDKVRPAVQETMTHWKADTDLAGVRDPQALAKLPPDERDTWQKLWKDVDALLARAQEKK